MNRFRFALAVLAALGIVFEPVAPSFATTTADDQIAPLSTMTTGDPLVYQVAATGVDSAALRQRIVSHAERGNAAILSAQQMESLATSNPALYAKLMTAYRSNTMPSLTPDEKKLMRQMTARNLTQFKAGLSVWSPLQVAASRRQEAGASRLPAGSFSASWVSSFC
jgi:hypothetical protein